jgi:hypothetical protein
MVYFLSAPVVYFYSALDMLLIRLDIVVMPAGMIFGCAEKGSIYEYEID